MPREAPETLSTEAFAARLRAVIRELSDFARPLAAVCDVRTSEADGYWRLTLAPHSANACPLDLFLRTDQQVDIAIGPETAEDLPAGDLSLYPRLVEAITAGRVVIRHRQAAATGVVLAVETRVTLDDVTLWRHVRTTDIGRRLGACETLACEMLDCDVHYLPYVGASAL